MGPWLGARVAIPSETPMLRPWFDYTNPKFLTCLSQSSLYVTKYIWYYPWWELKKIFMIEFLAWYSLGIVGGIILAVLVYALREWILWNL